MTDHLSQPPAEPGPEAVVSPPPRRRGRGKVFASVLGLLLVVGLAGGGVAYFDHRADVAAEREAEAERLRVAKEKRQAAREKREAERERREAAAAELEAARAEYNDCLNQIDPLLEDLQRVDARLDVGLDLDEFTDLVGDASESYADIDAEQLGTGACLEAGAKLETALNKYMTVASRWNDCVFDDYCLTDDIEPMMQRKWAAASKAIEGASEMLKGLDPSEGDAI